jgi:hypothetical protein
MVPAPEAPARERRELPWALLLAALGVLPRLALVLAYPTQPYSDFRQLIAFGQALQTSWVAKTWLWEFFNPGLPAALSLLFRIFPGPDDTVARLATAVLCGLLGLLPFLLWRGVLPFWARLTAGLLLALWPGQIAFSGVVAQDNWVLLPVVALGALAVRALRTETSWRAAVAAGLLFVLALATRQEMLVTLFPVALAAAGVWSGGSGGSWRLRRLVPFGLAAALLLLAFATQRHLATGRFTVMTKHTGTTVLSSYIPGATANYWADPVAYVATVRPELVLDRAALQEEALSLTWNEARRRPWFHTYRIFSALLKSAIEGETDNLYWSLLGAEVQLPDRQAGAQALASRLGRWLKVEMALLLALFLGALVLGAVRRNPAILVLSAFVILKYGLHVVTMAQGRYFLCVTAIGMLVGVLGLVEARRVPRPKTSALAFGAGALVATASFFAAPAVIAHVRSMDVVTQSVYQFPLESADGSALLHCRVEQGRLEILERNRFLLRPFEANPSPGEVAEAVCRLEAKPRTAGPVVLRIQDPYAPGGLPGRIVQRVDLDGREVWSHDLAAEAWQGWNEVQLGEVRPGQPRTVRIQIAAVQPDPGLGWGAVSVTDIQLARRPPAPEGAGIQRAGLPETRPDTR